MDDREDVLVLVQGSARSFELRFFDENDAPEDLSGASAASLRIVRDAADPSGTEILKRSSASSNLAIDSDGSKIVASLQQAEADALPVGTFLAEAALQFAGSWYRTDPFVVVITPAIASVP